ncbi:MAG TPA: hypothetical protein VM115_15655 [Vicinamibacterales bacterium]|nr:hypothetical protein [Vicinamibacterales bacterium]
MSSQEREEKRSTNPLGIIIALGALGLLLVLLFFQSSPKTDAPLDQGPIGLAVVNEMMTNGVLVDYDCSKNTAWVNVAVWTKYNFEQRRNMLIGLATVCDTRRAGYRISIIDYDTKGEIAAFDGQNLKMDK